MKRIRIENNTDYTFKIQATEFNKIKSSFNKTKAEVAEIAPALFGGYKTTLELYDEKGGMRTVNPFFPRTNKNFFSSSNPQYLVKVEILNSHNVILRTNILERGETWSIHHITEDEMSKTMQDEIVDRDIKKQNTWFCFW